MENIGLLHSILNSIFAAPRALSATTGVTLKASIAIFTLINVVVYAVFAQRALLLKDFFVTLGASFLSSSILMISICYVLNSH